MCAEVLDRRVRKTRKQLRECLVTLLKKKKVQEITVRELTEMADLNRGTFYLHYKDVFDLLEKTEEELLTDFNALMNKHTVAELNQTPAPVFNEIFTLVHDNADLIGILLGENGDLNFVNRLKQLIRDKCLREWMEMFHPENPDYFDEFLSYIVSGCVGLVHHWLAGGLLRTPEQMARMTELFITRGIHALEAQPEFALSL